MDSRTGEIKLVQSLTQKLGIEYTVTLYAQDKGDKPLRGILEWKFVIKVNNKFTPEIIFVSFSESANNCHIPENGDVNFVVGYFKVTDKDEGHAGITDFEVNNLENFKITEENDRFYIQTLVSFDFEQQNSYNITVKARDCQNFTDCDPYVTEDIIKLIICDVNDNYPIFDTDVFQVEVAEELKGVEPILRIIATDNDSGLNGEIGYIIAKSNISGLFGIGEKSGWLSIADRLDAEVLPQLLELEILAEDKGY